jgi:hypothetical protein
MLGHIAADFSSSTTLAGLGGPSLDCSRLAGAVQSGLGCFPLQGRRMGFLDLRRRLIRHVGHVQRTEEPGKV